MAVSLTVQEIATLVGGEPHGDLQATLQFAAPLAQAAAGAVAFAEGIKQRTDLAATAATLVLLSADLLSACPTHAIVVKNPRRAFATVLRALYPTPSVTPGVHPTACVAADAQIHPSASIGPYVVIGARTKVGPHCVLAAAVVIGDDCRLGEGCHLYPRVTLYHQVTLGARVIIHSGAVLGADGFGYELDEQRQWEKTPQVGGVTVEDDVEIGANTTIDRGALTDTVIGRGTKLDNLIMIAHNVNVGEHTIIAGCTGVAGSVKIGRHCMIGGHAAINGHIELADGVVVTGAAMVTRSLTTPGVYSSGTGILPNKAWLKAAVRFRQLEEIYVRLQQLEREVT